MINFKDIVIKYGEFVAMDNLNLEVKEGEFFSFLGPSGSGKTTVLRALTGFVKPSDGRIFVADKDITDIPIEKRNIGIVFQSYALFPTMNVYENIAYGLKVRKVPKEQIDVQVKEIARKIDLSEEQLYKKVSELSGGQQQRVAIARALIIKPKILCLDEPLSNLDAKLRHKLRVELKRLQREFGITTIYVTHDQEEALTLSDRIAVFADGRLEQVGTPNEIFNTPQTEFVANFIGETNKVDVNKLGDSLNKKISLIKDKDAYIMTHDITTKENQTGLKMTGTVLEKEYFGFYLKYTIITENDLKLKFMIVTSSMDKEFEVDEKIDVYIEKDKILQY